jgi:Phosphatidylinositol 3- and 4-kinase
MIVMSDPLPPDQLRDRLNKLKQDPALRVPFAFVETTDGICHLSVDTKNPKRSSQMLLDALKKEAKASKGAHGVAWYSGGAVILNPENTFSGLDRKALPVVKAVGHNKLVVAVAPPATKDDQVPRDSVPGDLGAVLSRELQQMKTDFDRARSSPVAGAKLAELWQKAEKHLAAKDLDKASADVANLRSLIEIALKHAAATPSEGKRASEQPPPQVVEPGRENEPAPRKTNDVALDSEAQQSPEVLKERLRSLVKTKLPIAKATNSAYLPDIARLANRASDLGLKGDHKGAHALLDELERLVDAVVAESGRQAEYREFQEEVRRQKNVARAKRLGDTLDAITVEKYFPTGSAERYAKEGLNPGKEFQLFLKALGNFEKKYEFWRAKRKEWTGIPKEVTPYLRDLDEMIGLTQSYLTHYEGLSDRQKKLPESLRKREICRTTMKMLQQVRIKAEFESLGDPERWGLEQQNAAAALYSKLLFEEGNIQASPLPADQSGISGAWWVEAIDFADPKPEARKKKFIFKPSDAEQEIPGFPPGGSAPREVVSKVVADQIQTATGIDFGFPETVMVAIDNDKLARSPDDESPVRPGPRVGSMQHFSKSDGMLRSLGHKDESVLAKIPATEVQKMAVLDLITLNGDRHSGNFLIGRTPGSDGTDNLRLIPIDHGLTIPSREGVDARRTKIGSTNALLNMPASREKFSQDMIDKIQMIDPNAVVGAMQDSIDMLDEMHPGATVKDKVPPANLELTRRSIRFLQKAARELTVDELFDAYAVNAEEIFDSSPENREQAFATAIAQAKGRSAARRELSVIRNNESQFKAFVTTIKGLGWAIELMGNSLNNWLTMNPTRVMNIYKFKLENPTLRLELDAMLEKLFRVPDTVAQIRRKTLRDGHAAAMAELRKVGQLDPPPSPEPDPASEEIPVALQEMEREFPGTTPEDPMERRAAARDWLAYRKLGGNKAYVRLGGECESRSLGQRLKDLRMLKREEAALLEIDTLDPEDHHANLEGTVAIRLDVVREGLARFKDRDTISPINVLAVDAQIALDAGRLADAETLSLRAENLLRSALVALDALVANLARRHEAVLEKLGALGVGHDGYHALVTRYKTCLALRDQDDFASCEAATKQLELDVDQALKTVAT